MLERQKLFWSAHPYDLEGTQEKFLRAVRANCAFHLKRCPEYRSIAQALQFSPDQLQTTEDLAKIPVLPTLFYKRHALFSMSRSRMAMFVTGAVFLPKPPWYCTWGGRTASFPQSPLTV